MITEKARGKCQTIDYVICERPLITVHCGTKNVTLSPKCLRVGLLLTFSRPKSPLPVQQLVSCGMSHTPPVLLILVISLYVKIKCNILFWISEIS